VCHLLRCKCIKSTLGRAAFICESDSAERQTSNLDTCPKCKPTYEWDRMQAQRVLEHIGCHILFDPTVDRNAEICGFCLHASTCAFFLRKGKGSSSGPQVDLARSHCPNLVKFAYQSASTSSANAPCSNVPLICAICPSSSPAVWRYNMKAHFKTHHTAIQWAAYEPQYIVSDSEKAAMQALWQKKPRTRRKSHKHQAALVISEIHSSRLATQ
jgi:hypothetical protein